MDDLAGNNLDLGNANENANETASIEDRLSGYFGHVDETPEEADSVDTNTADDVETDLSITDDEQPETDTEESDDVEATDDANDEITGSEPADDFVVKIGDEELTYGELKNGYFRQADYTRKTQELSSQRADLEQAQLAANQLVQKEVIDQMKHVYMVEMMGEPDWADIKVNDPFGYADKREAWDAKMAKFAELQTLERNMIQQRVDLENKRFAELQIKARSEFYERHPEFKDKAIREPLVDGMSNYLKGYGFTDDEIKGVADSRMLNIVLTAYKASQTAGKVEQAKKVISNKPKIMAPKPTGTRPQYENARNKLRQSGSTDDAIEALRHLF